MPNGWFQRRFELGLGPEAAPEILERLARAPATLAEAFRGVPAELITRRVEGRWSMQENAGHLADLESLWEQRLADYDTGAEVLHPADLENRKTHEAEHNKRAVEEILAEFSTARGAIVERLARMSAAELARTALHPRLRQPMSVVDLCFFVAEHDDHHLGTIEELRSALTRAFA